MRSFIELRDVVLPLNLGTYGPQDIVPTAHLLDLKLTINPQMVFVESDKMESIFDYDPLISSIESLAKAGHYETQEWLMTQIVRACAEHPEILAAEIFLRKTPVIGKTGEAGVRLVVDEQDMRALRATDGAPSFN